MFINRVIGAPVTFVVGRTGEPADVIPMRVAGFRYGQADGNPDTAPEGELAICVAWQPNRDGELIYRQRKVLVDSAMLSDRFERVEALDGPDGNWSMIDLAKAAATKTVAWAKDRVEHGAEQAPAAPAPAARARK